MRTLFIFVLVTTMGLFVPNVIAQESETNRDKIERLQERKEAIVNSERDELRSEVEKIMERLDNGEITQAEADRLKRKAAERRALNIENKVAILENQIALLERDEASENILEDDSSLRIVLGKNKTRKRKRKYDRRTTSDFVLAIGFNNAIIDGQSLDDSPYRVAGSRFAELGWAWKTRVFENTAWLRLKYGFSFQFNGLKPTGNRLFVNENGQTNLQEFDGDLDKSKLRMDNLVIPIHFEFGPYRKRMGEDYVRYSTHRRFKIGIGGYAGFNIGTRQKLKFNRDGDDVKEKQRGDFNTNDFIYGLSSYIALGDVAIYAKYDLNTIFKDNPIEQRNISLGVRFDMD